MPRLTKLERLALRQEAEYRITQLALEELQRDDEVEPWTGVEDTVELRGVSITLARFFQKGESL